MSIQTKIEEIRQKPEHIRMRYVLVSVAISMFVISILWVFSITTSFQNQNGNQSASPTTYTQSDQNIPTTDTAQLKETPSLNDWIKK